MHKTLTVAQQQIVEENHNLIYHFAKLRQLDIDDYYDILAIGLCNAAMMFDLNKGTFSTFAMKCMSNELNTYWRSLQADKHIPEDLITVYRPYVKDGSDSSDPLLISFPDTTSIYDIVNRNILYERIIDLLTEKEKDILHFVLNGESQVGIAKKMNCTKQNINNVLINMKKKINVLLSN